MRLIPLKNRVVDGRTQNWMSIVKVAAVEQSPFDSGKANMGQRDKTMG